jgi:hypothetical protein
MYCKMTLIADKTTAEFACCSRGMTRSIIRSASFASSGTYFASASRMDTWPHSVHSFKAAKSFCNFAEDIPMTSSVELFSSSAISLRAATAFATTVGFASATKSRNKSRKPRSFTKSGEMSCNFATQTAAVFRTYGSSSLRARSNGSHKYSVIRSTRMQPIVRIARARTSGFGSAASLTNVLTANKAKSGCVLA